METLKLVGVAGDWHGNLGHALSELKKFSELSVRYVFQLGDFGVWGSLLEHSGDKFRTRIQRELERNRQTLLVTLGNHENYDLVEKFSVLESGTHAGFLYEPRAPRILYFKRGQSITLEGVKFLSLGGAASIDFRWRQDHNASKKAGKLWWPQENITDEQVTATVSEAKRLESVDVFLAHDVFASAPIFETHRQSVDEWTPEDLAYAQKSRDSLEFVAREVRPKLWLHGHYHEAVVTEVEFPDELGQVSTVKTMGFAKDGDPKASGILSLDTLHVDYI